ncbi:MAG: 4-(cytidine 5'-diphospho)-2-C-methyl-D-erythritol kinase [Acetatifactor sp.]|nr:4-(cytidine 5'-diphospho)-2-C-methyl-D-erythritol kinase [Acetatifactor sp.]
MNTITVKAYAKINLGLNVCGRYPNGYHEVKMIMQTVGIYDELKVEKIPEGILLTTDSGELPADENNLVYKAAKLMKENYPIKEGVRIHLTKNIPIAAGMAGGSTDAAATLKAMNELFDLKIPREELMEKSVTIGADVPYCVLGGTALAEGIGEKLTVLPPAPSCYVLVAKPDINVSTKYVYEHLDAEGVKHHPDIDGMRASIEAGDLSGIISRLENVLEVVTVPAHPVIDLIKQRMLALGADGSLMSGSGPTVFGLFTDKEKAEKAFEAAKAENLAKHLFLTTLI